MGLDLKDIFKKDDEALIVDRKKQAIQGLIILSIIVAVLLVALVFLKNIGDVDETRRLAITKDIQNIQNYIKTVSNDAKSDPDFVYPGTSLEDEPITKNINGVIEEYRYGYYLLNPEDYKNNPVALNVNGEQYIVNYDTYDVVNVAGVKYNKAMYYSVDDLVAIERGQVIPSRNTVIIKVASDMQKLHSYPNANFKLAGNIDMTEYSAGEGWKPVENFAGKLDGRGYTITNLTINRPTQSYVGLFKEITSTASVINLTFTNVNVTGENYTGVLAGTMTGNVQNIIINGGSVTGSDNVGGLVGSHQVGTISKCQVILDTVAGQDKVGGAVGVFNSGTIQEVALNCTNMYALSSVGGFVGSAAATSASYLHECSAVTSISGRESIGGLIGKVEMLSNNKLDILNCYAKGTITDGEQNMGGLIGSLRTTAGTNLSLVDLYTAYSILNKGETSGGCVGYSNVSVSSPTSILDVFWEKNLALGEELDSVGTVASASTPLNFQDKTYDEMRYRSTFANWDFDVWGINERADTPYLKFENAFKQYVEKEKK